MATLVKFYKHVDGEVMAFFPQLNYNKQIYGNGMKTCYAHIGQHSACHVDYINDGPVKPATRNDYLPLATELTSIGYSLKILNKN